MAPVLLDMAVSLDGVVGGPEGEDVGLCEWYLDPHPAIQPIIEELVESSRAMVIGRGAFGTGDDAGSWDDTPYRVPHFVITHRDLPPPPSERTVEFIAVSDGVERALRLAQDAAGERYATIGGGADVARQCLEAGVVYEVQLHVVPIVLGTGLRLFDGPAGVGSSGPHGSWAPQPSRTCATRWSLRERRRARPRRASPAPAGSRRAAW